MGDKRGVIRFLAKAAFIIATLMSAMVFVGTGCVAIWGGVTQLSLSPAIIHAPVGILLILAGILVFLLFIYEVCVWHE